MLIDYTRYNDNNYNLINIYILVSKLIVNITNNNNNNIYYLLLPVIYSIISR